MPLVLQTGELDITIDGNKVEFSTKLEIVFSLFDQPFCSKLLDDVTHRGRPVSNLPGNLETVFIPAKYLTKSCTFACTYSVIHRK